MPLYDDFGTVPHSISNDVKIYSCSNAESGFKEVKKNILKPRLRKKFNNGIFLALNLTMVFSLIYFIYTKVDISGLNSTYLHFVSKIDNTELQTIIKTSFDDGKVTYQELEVIMNLHKKTLEQNKNY